MKWTRQDIEKLIKEGKVKTIAGFPGRAPNVDTVQLAKTIVAKVNVEQRSASDEAKMWIYLFLKKWCADYGLGGPCKEFRFHPVRKWRFDFAVVDPLQIAIEYEGLSYKKTGHTTSEGYTDNCDKYNQAIILGWKVFRVTYLNYSTLPKILEQYAKIHPHAFINQRPRTDGLHPSQL